MVDLVVPDRDKLNFFSPDSIDKILAQGDGVFIVNPGENAGATTARIVGLNIPNPAGQKGFVRYRWKTSATDWQKSNSRIPFGFNFDASAVGGPPFNPLFGLKAAVSVGASDDEIKFLTANGWHNDVVLSGGGAEIYTPTSQVFEIEWALFAIE